MLILRCLCLLALLSLAACGLPAERSDGEPGSGFPHTENWRYEHGENGTTNPTPCFTCHDEEAEDEVDYRGGERLPPCNGCHVFPFDEEETAARDAIPPGWGQG